ncbi:MAG: NADPH dependent preQ0 reductase [uncultured Rubrobacteraceae bacterium]|uniref:NADPH dependent preQ0 reductase n=1 Tax=uncultured Rubrobacteraceae bacterium TaxID=349277 RepID=A0A6J4Q8H5_9ACTN|nr:MAG: NADPH dependent preQ0 reductase [uncultured Rubrobacteraceae bacterium]
MPGSLYATRRAGARWGRPGPDRSRGYRHSLWSRGGKDAVVEFTTDELTAICPLTGQPDFYDPKLSYRPKGRLLESKAMKLYLSGASATRAFAEDLAATLLEDLVAACDPVEMTVDLTQRVRGGL